MAKFTAWFVAFLGTILMLSLALGKGLAARKTWSEQIIPLAVLATGLSKQVLFRKKR